MDVMKRFDLTGKVALVTGSTRGLGKVSAIGLAQAGASVVVVGTKEAAGVEVAKEIATLTGSATLGIGADVSKEADVEALFAKSIEAFGKIDVVFNNAGIASVAPAEDITTDMWNETIDVNLKGVFLCTRAAGKHMIANKGGSIINMASMTAHIANIPQQVAHYAASKAGVIGLSRNCAAEWAPHNVRVNVISPGYHLTEMAQQFSSMFEYWLPLIPMGRMADMEEITGIVVFLASQASSYVTGAEIVCDGGYTLR